MRQTHATWNAIAALVEGTEPIGAVLSACDWSRFDDSGAFDRTAAAKLTAGEAEEKHPLPSCPRCAALVDMALTIRAESDQAKAEAEMDREKTQRTA